MNCLNWLVAYVNYNGYYIYDLNNYNYGYYYDYNCNNQQRYPAPIRRRDNRRLQRNYANNNINQNTQGAKREIKAIKCSEQPAKNSCESSKALVKKAVKENAVVAKKGAEITKRPQQAKHKKEEDKKETGLATQHIQKPKQKPKHEVQASQKTQHSNPYNNKDKFPFGDPSSPEFILSLRRAFTSEIKSMQVHMLSEASQKPVHSESDLIVAKIFVENNSNITDDIFEFIRTELVGWIGVYQQQGMNTPIFHSILNNNSYITIVCDNKFAFECVKRCVEEILQTKTMSSLKILSLPPTTSLIYCFDAEYEGIVSDSNLFLSQLHLHKPKLYSDLWVVASHKVCPEERKTYFIFLIDERSALALNFHYNQTFYVCMQQATFRYRGIVNETSSK